VDASSSGRSERDDIELIFWRFEECKDLKREVEEKHEEYISQNPDDGSRTSLA